jgi:hypothetical protein
MAISKKGDLAQPKQKWDNTDKNLCAPQTQKKYDGLYKEK